MCEARIHQRQIWQISKWGLVICMPLAVKVIDLATAMHTEIAALHTASTVGTFV